MRGRTGVTVGKLCGDPDQVTTAIGGTANDPCPNSAFGTGFLCNEYDTKAWITAAQGLRASISAAWTLLQATEDAHGTQSEQVRLEPSLEQLFRKFRTFPTDSSNWVFFNDNFELVHELIAWMTTAACRLDEINRAIRKYKVTPPEAPAPGPSSGTVQPTVPRGGRAPRDKPATQIFGETTLMLLGISLVAGGVYLYRKRRIGRGIAGLGLRSKTPLPPRK